MKKSPFKYFVSFEKITLVDYVSIISTVSAGIPLLLYIEDIQDRGTASVILTMYLLVVAAAISNLFARLYDRYELRELLALFTDQSEVRKIGGKETAINEISMLSDRIVRIRNTHVVSGNITHYYDDEISIFLSLFSNVVKNRGHVYDYFGGLSKDESEPVKQHYGVYKEMSALENYHGAYFEGHSFPFLNFMIIDVRDEMNGVEKHVYFGWGGNKVESSNVVFASQEADMVAMFESIHESVRLRVNEIQKSNHDEASL